MPVEARARLPRVLAGATILLQIGYPLSDGTVRDRLTVAIVVCFALATGTHAWSVRGMPAVLVLTGVAAIGLVAEWIGLHTGVPFGRYAYRGGLGLRLGGVPLVVPLAWAMMAWPGAQVARRLARSRLIRVLAGAWALAAWDLFLDPQMVAAGHWWWLHPSPHLPGVDTVPLTNYAGWLLVAIGISLALQVFLDAGPRTDADPPIDDRQPLALFGWTYASSVLALAVFLPLVGAAAWGALGMGIVVFPLAAQAFPRLPRLPRLTRRAVGTPARHP